MATFDSVGVPFPKDAPLFLSDPKIQKKIQQIESLIEIRWDTQDISLYLHQASFLKTPHDVNSLSIISGAVAKEALVVAAVVGYGKLFKSATCRTVLNPYDIFDNDTHPLHMSIIDFRDKLLAHQEWNANCHHLYYFKGVSQERPTLNPNGHTVRFPIAGNLNIDLFLQCVSRVEQFVQSRIESLCLNLQASFSQEQIDFLNSDLSDITNPFFKKQPYASRSKS